MTRFPSLAIVACMLVVASCAQVPTSTDSTTTTYVRGEGCPREERGSFMDQARSELGEEVVLVTHCVLKPIGPAKGTDWNKKPRKKYSVSPRWKPLLRDGSLVGVPTKSPYRLEGMAVKAGELVRLLSTSSRKFFEVEAVAGGVIEVSKNHITSDDGRTVIAYPLRIVTPKSVMKWNTEGVSMCYPSDGDDNYTRGSYNGKSGELYRAVARPGKKNYTATFSVSCDG